MIVFLSLANLTLATPSLIVIDFLNCSKYLKKCKLGVKYNGNFMEGLIELDTLDYSSNYTKVSLKLKKK